MLSSMDAKLCERRRQDRAAVLVWLLAMVFIAGLAVVAHWASRSLARDLRAVASAGASSPLVAVAQNAPTMRATTDPHIARSADRADRQRPC